MKYIAIGIVVLSVALVITALEWLFRKMFPEDPVKILESCMRKEEEDYAKNGPPPKDPNLLVEWHKIKGD